jgi:hypothetical protein
MTILVNTQWMMHSLGVCLHLGIEDWEAVAGARHYLEQLRQGVHKVEHLRM